MRRQAAVAFLRALGRAGGEAPASAGSSCRLPAAAALLSRHGFADDASLLKTPLYEFHISNGGAAGGSAGCVTETCSGALLCDALLVQQCQAVDKQPWTQALNAARSVPVNNPCSQDGSVCRLVHAHSVQGELALRQAPLRRTAAISFKAQPRSRRIFRTQGSKRQCFCRLCLSPNLLALHSANGVPMPAR